MQIGYTLMTEQSAPRDLVRYAGLAEQAGFDFEVMSDHYFPWLDEQGHAGYAWAMLGAVTQVTDRVELMTYVTCPTTRYHPAVVAQKAATVQQLSGGRFTLGVGSGENLNEHVVGHGWPTVHVRHEMLVEALEIINELFDGGYVNHEGEHFTVSAAKVWDLPGPACRSPRPSPGRRASSGWPRSWTTWWRSSRRPTWSPSGRAPAPAATAPSARCRSRGTPTGTGRWPAPTSSSAGSAAAGPSTPSSRSPPASPARRSSCVPRTSPTPSPADRTSRRSSRRSPSGAEAGFTDLALVQIGDERQEDFLHLGARRAAPGAARRLIHPVRVLVSLHPPSYARDISQYVGDTPRAPAPLIGRTGTWDSAGIRGSSASTSTAGAARPGRGGPPPWVQGLLGWGQTSGSQPPVGREPARAAR